MLCNYLGMLVKALELEWDLLSEEIGFWLPAEVTNEEHDDKPEGEEEPGNISQNYIPDLCFCSYLGGKVC